MDHFPAAEERPRAESHEGLADRPREDCLPRGVLSDGRWSYAALKDFESSFPEMTGFERAVREAVTGGERYVAERPKRRPGTRARGQQRGG